MQSVRHCPGPITRRNFLGAGAFGVGALSLPDLFRMKATAAEHHSDDDTAVILLWLPGGAPHLDMYDMKPDATADYRGEFRPIHSNVPGIDVCELLPFHAKCADKYAIIRSIHHKFADHGGGHKRFLTGRDPLEPTGFVNDYPMVGSLVSKCRDGKHAGLPNYIAGVDGGRQQVDTFSFGAAYLGQATTPFTFYGDPAESKFSVQNLSIPPRFRHVARAANLLKNFDSIAGHRLDWAMSAMDTPHARPSSWDQPKARDAFDLSKEPAHVRERYACTAMASDVFRETTR